jgi:hypothetical protein
VGRERIEVWLERGRLTMPLKIRFNPKNICGTTVSLEGLKGR